MENGHTSNKSDHLEDKINGQSNTHTHTWVHKIHTLYA
jgi:hypothetical protein